MDIKGDIIEINKRKENKPEENILKLKKKVQLI